MKLLLRSSVASVSAWTPHPQQRLVPSITQIAATKFDDASQQPLQQQQRQVRWYQGQDPTVLNKELAKHQVTGEESIYKLGKHRSNALELVRNVPIVDVDRNFAICDGGGGALGHPLQYIAIPLAGDVRSCKYCSLRYRNSGKGKASH